MKHVTTPLVGSIVALITPMQADGAIDFQALRQLVNWHIEQGTNCIGAAGTTGESPTITMEEQCEIIRVCIEEAKGRIPILAGCGANSTAESVALARHAQKLGASYQLQVVPYYNKPTQEGLYQHFRTIAEATELPMMLYNVPGRTVADLAHETTMRLAEVPGIFGIKDATANIERGQWLIRQKPNHFSVYSGDDCTAVTLMLCGGSGNISVTANVAPRLMSELCQAALSKNTEHAMNLQMRLLRLHRHLFSEPNPIPVKWAVAQLGKCTPAIRLPLTPATAVTQVQLKSSMAELGLI